MDDFHAPLAPMPVHQQPSDKAKGKQVISLLPSFEGGVKEDSLPWVEKYRPSQLDELISHGDIIQSVSKFIDQNKLPHLLFYGPPGTGKTSMILAVARKLYGPKYKSMILELNASDDRGIDVVREQIKNFASTKKIFSSGFKLIILDECDAMTQVAQNALRRIVEKYTQNVRFCIICNYVSKIIPALQSRCTRFRFAPIPESFIRTRLDHVVAAESINITETGRSALLKLSKGDMRRMLNILQAVHAAYPVADEVSIYTCVGAPVPGDIVKMADWLFGESFDVAHSNIKSLKQEKGLALSDMLLELHAVLQGMELPPHVRVKLLVKLAEVEYNLSVGCSEKLQLASLVGGFKNACDLVV
ncbi:P-loop containing nucleoside triphosphate hydrolase protein [Rhizoclosmatium globosum]|uniref:Replication factor C subunit 3 n=1 Tax=Rhizoclosmatium globosum TaxID=329046 RepID=A0A1Y2BP62_9FUNG|nr:P-loop containing nucleoside triphosphate hydrolase protein [Rhizoclosmatium globosum]|eukprot:ORY36540.1 P-loop containing nucleoside triphosphate hydrolase protein [Rhizoclosmatium globosum]